MRGCRKLTVAPEKTLPCPVAARLDRKILARSDLRVRSERMANVTFETNQGTIKLKCFSKSAPKTVENFTKLAQKGYYDGITFHRVIKGFMVQCGDPTGTGSGGESIWGKPFKDEFDPSLEFDRPGILAMANAGPNTNGSQFFITTAPAEWLHMKHTIFGEVSEGMDVVRAIENTDTDRQDRPVTKQKIIKATVDA